MADTIEKTVDSGKTFFDISVTTEKFCVGYQADTPENDSNRPIVCDLRTKIWLTNNCVYETLSPKLLACPPSCSPGNLFTTFLQLIKSEATSCNSYLDIFFGSFRCSNLQRALTQKMQRR